MGRRPTRIAGWRRRCSRMGSGKRASMREGPLANLFRKTETEGLQDPPPQMPPQDSHPPAPDRREPQVPERATPTPQERLRHAFSSEIPGDMMSPPEEAPREVPPPSAADYQWNAPREETVGQPQLRVVG